ncbi:helix-turn-helix domain-containing protein [Runella aurantiaca]|uniref:Helix-turn-helix domain-containing protein n=1 Tax=Runella aurantiaca TaxID=2282308 RepID=A0A369I067_9BACT|nr:helix-turn-helix domain-containing protein [Runella aurantiaca]RDB02270.1 helix-turn-helix domain-containing protein [Runella aurantiaca]
METIRPIKTEQDYELALKKLEMIFHAKPNTPEGDLLEVLSLLVHEYEQKHYKIERLSPLEALKYEMEEQGLSQTGLAKRVGMSKSTISEIMNGKKQMSINFMKFLHNELGIPAHILLAY